MNRHPALPLIFCVAAFCFAFPAARAQTVVNPGFEQELSDWLPRFDFGMSSALAGAARTGAFGLRVTDAHASKGSGLESLAIEAYPGKKYEVSFWARTVSGEGGVAVALRFFDEHGKNLLKKGPSVKFRSSPEWQKFSVTGTAPEFAVAFCIRIQSLAMEMVTADLDDFEVREVP